MRTLLSTLSSLGSWVHGRARRRCCWTWTKKDSNETKLFAGSLWPLGVEMKTNCHLGTISFFCPKRMVPSTQVPKYQEQIGVELKTNYHLGTVSFCRPKRSVTQRVEFSCSTEQNFLHLHVSAWKYTGISSSTFKNTTAEVHEWVHQYIYQVNMIYEKKTKYYWAHEEIPR